MEETREGYLYAEEAVAFACLAYEQSLGCQQNGISSAYELFQAQEEYLGATLSWIQMRYELAVAFVALRVARGEVF